MSVIDRARLLQLMRSQRYAVESTVTADGAPQSATVGVVVSDRFEVFFDTLGTSRKAANLRQHPRVALVFGPNGADAAWTMQCEGTADEPTGEDLERLLPLYFERFPDGRDRQQLPGITYVRVRLRWIRCSDYTTVPPTIVEFGASDLG